MQEALAHSALLLKGWLSHFYSPEEIRCVNDIVPGVPRISIDTDFVESSDLNLG